MLVGKAFVSVLLALVGLNLSFLLVLGPEQRSNCEAARPDLPIATEEGSGLSSGGSLIPLGSRCRFEPRNGAATTFFAPAPNSGKYILWAFTLAMGSLPFAGSLFRELRRRGLSIKGQLKT